MDFADFDFADFDFALGADKLLDFEGGDPQPTAAAPWTRLASVRWHRIAAETSSRWPMSSISVGEEDCDRPSAGSTTHNVEEELVMDAILEVRGVADPDPSESWLDWLETSLRVFELRSTARRFEILGELHKTGREEVENGTHGSMANHRQQ